MALDFIDGMTMALESESVRGSIPGMRLQCRALVGLLVGCTACGHTPLRFGAAEIYRLAPLGDGRTRSVKLQPEQGRPVRIRATDPVVLRVWALNGHRTRELRIIPGEMRYSVAGMRFPDRVARSRAPASAARGRCRFQGCRPTAAAAPHAARGLLIRYLDVESFTTSVELEEGTTSTMVSVIGGVLLVVGGLMGYLLLQIHEHGWIG